MNLIEKLTKARENQAIIEFFRHLRATTNELALNNSLVTEDDLVIHSLNGTGNDFKEITAVSEPGIPSFKLKIYMTK